MSDRPVHLDLQKNRGLTVEWQDGRRSHYPVGYLRRMSPSAEAKALREEMARNPLTVLPAGAGATAGPLTAVSAELVGNYAVKIRFSDGHDTGIYSWRYLREIDPGEPEPDRAEAGHDDPGHDEAGQDDPGHAETRHDETGHAETRHDDPRDARP